MTTSSKPLSRRVTRTISKGSRSARVDINRVAEHDDGKQFAVFKTTNYLGRDYYDGYVPFHTLKEAQKFRDTWLAEKH